MSGLNQTRSARQPGVETALSQYLRGDSPPIGLKPTTDGSLGLYFTGFQLGITSLVYIGIPMKPGASGLVTIVSILGYWRVTVDSFIKAEILKQVGHCSDGPSKSLSVIESLIIVCLS